MARVGWIGLGGMGVRMVGRLADAGHEVTVWNRTARRAEELAGRAGVRVAGSVAEAVAGAEVVGVMVSDPAALAEVVGGIAGAVAAGSTVVDFSTVGPEAVAAARAALPAGVELVDSPVFGSLTEAEGGTLELLVGGSAGAVERCRPVLEPLGRVVPVGESGAGAAAKLVVNYALLGSLALLGECVALADGLGVERDTAWRLLEATPLAAQATRRRPAVESGTYPPRFALRLAGKDVGLVADAAEGRGVDLRLARVLAGWFADAEAAGLGERDYTALLARIIGGEPDEM